MRLLPLLLLTALLAGCPAEPEPSAPRLQLADGHEQTLADLNGRWLVINYWAIWCKPCIHEIPEFNRLAREQAAQVAVFGIDFDGAEGAVLEARRQQLGIEFPLLGADPAAGLGHPRPNVLPTTVIYNPEGRLHTTLIGPQDYNGLLAAIGISTP